MFQILRPMPEETQPQSALQIDLRTSVEAGYVVLALAQSDACLRGKPMPDKITDLHHAERRRIEDVAILALRLLNRDAELYAEQQAAQTAFEELEQFCKDHDLDWLDDDNPINKGDALEMLVGRIARKVVLRNRGVLNGHFPGLSQHLAKLAMRGLQ